MNKKVCMFVWNHFTNDARVLREATALVDVGYEVYVVCLYDKYLPKSEDVEGVRVERIKGFKPYNKDQLKKSKLIWLLNTIIAMIIMIIKGIKLDADIYHSHDLNTLIQGYLAAKIFRRGKLIYDSHEVQTSRTGILNKNAYYLEKFLINRVDEVITTTDMRSDYIQDLYKIRRPKVVRNYPVYIDTNNIEKIDLYELANIPKEEPILLYQGGLQEGRGQELIIKAMPKIERGVLVFIGDGSIKEKLKDLVEDMELISRVRFIDKVSLDDLPKYTVNGFIGLQLLQNTCFNHYSALSNKLFEYIMCEVPIVVSNYPEMKKIVNESKVGVTIKSNVINNISESINSLLSNRTLWIEYKNNCRLAKTKYNWENEKYFLYDIYDEILLGGAEYETAIR